MGKRERELAKLAEKRRHKITADFVRRHPAKAREETALRKANRRLQADWGHKRAGTPETHEKASRVQQGALARLFMAGSISADQLAWAAEIRVVAERIGADVAIGTVSLETRVDTSRSFDGTFFEKLGAVRAEVAYTAWRASLAKPAPVLAMIVEDMACLRAARLFHMRTETARRLLTEALDAWPDFSRMACDSVDEATLLAAQAAIL
ncbi:conserved hypothetical protein [Altererythrobacter sp. B11]|uniref:hypothetical protein n=1 Tax=Altererythrobacter sp. B11 TaxID=2060312 RepID=UPI000DC7404A|nr:hypothetical protein [Altererythrobacter sp. B11]BBC72904.1 conserved hypothetical protein [Altererythrobacter sp. B11]